MQKTARSRYICGIIALLLISLIIVILLINWFYMVLFYMIVGMNFQLVCGCL